VAEIKGESEAEECGDEKQKTTTGQSEESDCQVANDADGRHGNVLNFSVRTAVYGAAIPPFVDGTRLSAGIVVDLKSEGGNHDSSES
jgi:hypothetical protein